jgi:hypothetical protein
MRRSEKGHDRVQHRQEGAAGGMFKTFSQGQLDGVQAMESQATCLSSKILAPAKLGH